jgi:hypothetical protein
MPSERSTRLDGLMLRAATSTILLTLDVRVLMR